MNFILHNPTRIVFGVGSLSKLPKESQSIGINKPLIVIGQGSVKKNGILDRVLELLKDFKYAICENIKPNPTVDDVIRGKNIFLENGCDSVIALGGGSVMDAAKVISLVAKEGFDPWEYTANKKPKDAYPIITIPTLSATGSEADPIAVINNLNTGEKKSVSGMCLYPKFSIIDPELTITTPLNATVDGFIDIIVHASETFLSTKDRNVFCDGVTETIVKMVIENGPKIIANTTDIKARTEIALASTMAMYGILYPRSGGWPMHAIEHAISGLYPDISHGSGLAAIFPAIVEWDGERNIERVKQYIKIFGYEVNTAKEASEVIKNFIVSIKAFKGLKDLGVKKEDLNVIAEKTLILKGNKENKLLNIEPMGFNDILNVLERSY
ncbi:MAG TPA: iron-containing alcohol dehydrogenase [Spirochaetota bacterium]|nr:iron-containing alcohol dehydrogenase [Spirochaetota bacterium]HOM37637.1 iron-containing alcohol dehydrogenase [Spirochaetota bacterium]HPQ49392.1 iron-containing alcohol dehydrogenase [Spirochaetota bacterium]